MEAPKVRIAISETGKRVDRLQWIDIITQGVYGDAPESAVPVLLANCRILTSARSGRQYSHRE